MTEPFDDLTRPLTASEILARLATVGGAGSTLDADTVRGHETQPGVLPRMPTSFLPASDTPPSYGEVLALYTFGR